MKRLVDCLGKLTGKLVTREDADLIVKEAQAYQASGVNTVEAERRAVEDAIRFSEQSGASILQQIHANIPQAHAPAVEFWTRQTIRKEGEAPPVAPPPIRPALRETPQVVEPYMPTVVVNGEPFTATSHAEAVVQAVRKHGKEAAKGGALGMLDDQGRFVSARTNDIEDQLTAAIRDNLPEAEIRDIEARLEQSRAADAKVPVTELGAPIKEEAPAEVPPPIPEAPSAPALNPAQQAVVDSLPENQREKATRALEVDTSPDPHEPLPPAEKMAPEENKILGEASKYGLLDDGSTAQSVMERIAADRSQPRWIRTIMDLLVKVGAGRNVEIQLVNRPDSNWPALYVNQGRNKPGQILINLAVVSERGLAQAIAHEATHHVTMMKLRFDDYPLTDTEREAKEQLQKIFEDIKQRPEFKKEYARHNLWEFASEVFSNDRLRAKLNAITPEGSRLTLMQIIRRLLAQVGFGDRSLLAGSLLDEAIRNTINVAAPSAVVRERIVTAPMAAEVSEHRMDIKREKREMAEKTRYTNAERTLLHDKIAKLLDKKGLTGAERAETERKYRAQVEDQVRAARAKFSVEGKGADRWMAIEPKDVELQIEKGRKAQKAKKGRGGKPDTPAVEAIPDTEKAVVKWVEEAYTFEKGTDATEMARKVVDSVKEIVAKSKDPNAEGHANAVIQMRQRGWYRNMTQRLRQEFGGFADIFADLLGALSPNTGVDQNWKFAIIALRNVSRGVYDAELKVFDEWLKSGRGINEYKDSGQPMIVQPNGKLFGMNSDKAMKAMLDYWRLIKSGDSPKARNFALNLIGQSNKATIDVWAARFLQRMAGHPRVPILAEKAVAGKHLTDVTKVGGAFGFGQEVFNQATEILRKEMPEEFGQLNPPDLQALVWFAEKELWGTKDWTSTIGEGGSFEAMADLEQVNRYLVGLSHERPHSVPTTQQQLAASKSLNAQLGEMGNVIASRVKDSYGMFMGTPERSFDIEVLTGPGFDPWEMVLHVASSAAANNQDSTFLSRVIPDGEINGNARPGLEVYFKEDVGPAALNSIMDFLKAKEVDGFTLVVDPRAEERVAKPVQMRGIRFQYIPEFSKDGDQWSEKAAEKEQILREAIDGILSQEGVASVQLVQYDTLVLTRNDYGNQINERELSRENVGGSRARVWIERARDAQYSGTTEGGEGGGAVGAPAIPGGGTEPTSGEAAARAPPIEEAPITAPMAPQHSYEDETTPLPDPHTGRAGLVRAMAQRLADSGWNRIESGPLSFGALSDLGRGAAAGGARVASVWRSLARSFRRREAALHGRIQEASRVLQRLNPDATGDQISQKLFDYLVNRDQLIGDIELAGYIDQIRDRVPVVPQANFTSLPKLEAGAEARVFRDAEAGVVYKLFKVQDGKTGSITPGEIRLGSDNQIRVFPGPRPSFPEFLGRIDRANSHGSIMPMEFVATTDAGDAVFAQPYFTGRGVSDRNAASALKQLDLGVLTQLGGTAALGKVNGKWVLFDDLHSRNVQTAPGGLVEVIDAINRELTQDEVDDLGELGLLPDVPDRLPITAPMAQEPAPVQYVLSGQSRSHGDVPVTVDIAKLDAAHAKEFPGDRVGPEGKGGIGTRYQQFEKWLSQGKPVEMSEMNFDHYGRPQFINGRHRFAVLRDQGQRTIDVAVPPDQVAKFREAFAPEPQRPQITPALDRPGMAPQVGPVTQFGNAIVTAPMVQAYHGTPHEFEQFTTEKVGTGEGAQVYGWGLYFAQRRAVAEAYQKTTAAYTIDGMPVREFRKQFPSSNLELARKENIPIDQATERWQKIKPLIDAVGAVEDYADNAEFMLRSTEAKKALRELEASGRLKKTGNLYNVELDVNDDELLDWDKPLSQQSEKVKQALADITRERDQMEASFLAKLPSQPARELTRRMIHGTESERTDTENWEKLSAMAPDIDLNAIHDIADYSLSPGLRGPLHQMSGADIYRYIADEPRIASEEFLSLGIPGIRYLDQGSREPRPPYRGDSAFLHAAEGMKEYGYSKEQALKAMLEAYSNIPASDLHAAINEVYDIQPEQTYNYVIFDGKDIRIVAQNGKPAGTVADAEAAPVTAPMVAPSEEGFYSGIAKVLDRKMPASLEPIPARTVKGRTTPEREIRNPKTGELIKVIPARTEPDKEYPAQSAADQVKAIMGEAEVSPEEIKWSGVNQAIDRIAAENNGRVPKEALLQYLADDGAVGLEEHVARATATPRTVEQAKQYIAEMRSRGLTTPVTVADVEESYGYTNPQDYIDLAAKFETETYRGEGRVRYPTQVLPGGENYREVVLAMPSRDARIQRMDELKRLPHTEENIAEYDRLSTETQGRTAVQYTSSHFPDVPNYVAHARMNDRTDAEGKPGLFLEEIQSDRHQQGREKGYVSEEARQAFEDAKVAKTKYVQEVIVPKYGPVPPLSGPEYKMNAYRKQFTEEEQAELDRLNDAVIEAQQRQGAIPDAPFRQSRDWGLQLFKRALRDAVEAGKSWIGWTGGDTQAERYDLSKKISEVHYSGTNLKAYDHDGNTVIEQTGVSREQLPDYIGKEAAEKLLAQPMRGTLRSLEGVDLKVGGEGMKGFYDKILPNEIGKYVRQWGGKVERGSVSTEFTESKKDIQALPPEQGPNGYRYGRASGQWSQEFKTLQEAQEAYEKEFGQTPIWKVEITPQMKETIPVKGQSLFGAVAPMQATETPVQDGTDVISSPLHPQGHQTRFWFGGGVPGSGYQAGGLFTARGRFNKEIWNALRSKTQNGRAVEMEADLVATQFRRLMKKTFGKKGPAPAQLRDINMALGTTDNRLTDAQAKQASQFRDEKLKAQFIAAAHLQNVQAFKADQQAALARLPDDMRDLIIHMRDLIDTASKNLVKDAGLSTDLKAAITENMGVYLHRSYKIFEHNDEWINFLESQRPEAQKIIARARVLFETYAIAQKAKDHALEMKKAGTPVTLAQARVYAANQDVTQEVDALLEDYKLKGEEDSNVNLMAGRLPGKRGEAIMKERGQIPQEIRELWGEWDDPGINFMKSYVAAVTYLENTKFHNAVLTHGLNSGYMWKKGVSKGARPAKWVEIAGSSKSMGALADVYGPKELEEAFRLYNSPRVQGWIEKFLSATIALPLAAKTVGSIGSTIRNFFGNPAFALANGNVFNGSLWNATKTSAAKLAKMGSDQRKAYLRELVSLGIVGEDVTQGLLNDLINAAQKESLGIDPNENVLKKTWNASTKAMGKTIKGAAGLYSGVDNFWKIYGYEAELGKLKRAYRNDPAAPSEAEMKKQAADIVRKTMPTYSEAPAIMRETKAIGRFIAPFIMFKTEVMRVTYGTLHQAGIEIANPNWRIKRIGIQRLVGSAVMAALPWLLASATKFIFGYDDDDEDTIRDALPQWQKNATLFFLPKDKDGNPRYLDLSYMNPFNVIHAPITAAARALKSGDADGPAMSAAAAGFYEFMRPFISEQLGVAAMVDVMRNQDSRVSLKPLYNAQDTGTQKVKAVAERLWHTFSPGTIDSIERIYQAKHGIVPKSGMPLSLGNEIMSPILGTKISTYDRMRGLSGQTARFEADKRDAGQLFTDPFNSRGTVSEGAVADGYRKANEARKTLYYQMRRNYLGALSLGLTEKQARNWMVIGTGSEFNKKGLTQADVSNVIHGKYVRYEASKESINEQRRLHPERVKEYKAALDAAPQVESIVD